jgi:hypothetical protein
MASPGPRNVDGLVVDEDLALVGAYRPVEDVHQRALARAVLAEQCVDLAGLDDEVDGVVGGERAEALRDATELELHVGPFRAVGAARGGSHARSIRCSWAGSATSP